MTINTDTLDQGRLSRSERVALAVALCWGAALLPAAAVAPVYQSASVTSSGAVTRGSATLLNENGSGILLIVAVPLLVSLIVGYSLWRRGVRRSAGAIAWTFIGLLAGFNLVSMLSIGAFILPVTACLVSRAPSTHRELMTQPGVAPN